MTLANDNLPRTPEAYLTSASGSADIALATRARRKADAFPAIYPPLTSFQSGDRLRAAQKLKPRTYGPAPFRWAMVVIVVGVVIAAAVQAFA
ncbi:hypothetical protein GCM10011415_28370 [Salipiger pallidus]|uniref:Uncharacterized protein n=1 Tax=Salipiger pallidus TaxID=1775170 RepID=A0A8J3EGN8_9RHOB|nr:hypothetical protein [Salipiger pallidus]GGG77771.1 hypothetical protein GCM10011415_28370 [Salipiger pallidus]